MALIDVNTRNINLNRLGKQALSIRQWTFTNGHLCSFRTAMQIVISNRIVSSSKMTWVIWEWLRKQWGSQRCAVSCLIFVVTIVLSPRGKLFSVVARSEVGQIPFFKTISEVASFLKLSSRLCLRRILKRLVQLQNKTTGINGIW